MQSNIWLIFICDAFKLWVCKTCIFYVFQRYGYDGFVQLHHHCKVSHYFLCFPVQLQTGCRCRSTYALHYFVEHTADSSQLATAPTPQTCQAGPGYVSSCRTQQGDTASVK